MARRQRCSLYRLGFTALLLASIAGFYSPLFSEGGSSAPKYQTLRYNEDWSAWKDHVASGDLFDPIKYMDVADSVWVSVGGQLRSRIESWSEFGFGGTGTRDDSFLLGRLLVHGDVHVTEFARVFVQGISALSTDRQLPGGRSKPPLFTDELDLQNAFVDLNLPIGDMADVTIRAGRQELLFGSQRLVSPLDWANTRRTFEGFSAPIKINDWTITPFWVRPVPADPHDFNDTDDNTEFYGGFASGKMPWAALGIDFYWLEIERENRTFNGTSGQENRSTVGGRLKGKLADTGVDFEAEFAYQFGEVGTADISAWMFSGVAGYKLPEEYGAPKVALSFDYASGDNSSGGDVNTFNHLFPFGHFYLGWIDIVGRQNILDVSPSVTMKFVKKLTGKVMLHNFWRADSSDALYNAGGGVVRAGNLGSSKEIGQEVDLLLKYPFSRHTVVLFGYSHFFAGKFIEQSGSSKDIDFTWFMWQYTF